MQEILVTIGVWASGAMLYTFLLKFAVPVYTGKLRFGLRAKGIVARDIMTRHLITVSPETEADEIKQTPYLQTYKRCPGSGCR